MLINLRGLLAGEVSGSKVAFDYELSLGSREFDFDIETEGVTLTSPIRIKGAVTDMGGYMSLTADASLDYSAECARCLKPLSRELSVTLERTVITEGSLENTPEEEADDYIEIVDGMLDIEPSVMEEIMMAFPARELCDEDCKGLCPKCGKNLNEGSCSCETKEIDPRLAVLKKLLDNQ